MESLLTLSIGEYSSVEIALRLTVVLMAMISVLLALTASCVVPQLRFPLFLAAVALGGAAWFESGVWQSWKEAFELAGTSYAVSGHLIADEDRIIAWSLGVPAILFCFGLTQIKQQRAIIWFGVILFLMALVAPFSTRAAFLALMISWTTVYKRISITMETNLLWGSILVGLAILILHPASLGGGASGELVRGEILRSFIDILSLVIPAIILLIGVLRLSKTDQRSTV